MTRGRVLSEGDLNAAVREMLTVVRAVEDADMSARVSDRLDESDPLGALGRRVNEIVASLETTRVETASVQQAIEDQITTIERQNELIRELSTPVIEVWSGILCVPVVGVFDRDRATETASSLLRAIVEKRSRLVIIDLTGIETMDTETADHFMRMARAARNLGSECVISGLSPRVADTIVGLGVDMSGIRTFRSLRDALRRDVRKYGIPGHEKMKRTRVA